MRISSKRQISIPKHIMTAMNLEPGDEIEIRVENGAAYLIPIATIKIPRNQAWFWTKDYWGYPPISEAVSINNFSCCSRIIVILP